NVLVVEAGGVVLLVDVSSASDVLVVVGALAQPLSVLASHPSAGWRNPAHTTPRQRVALFLTAPLIAPVGRRSQHTTAPGRPHVESSSQTLTARRHARGSATASSARRTQRR